MLVYLPARADLRNDLRTTLELSALLVRGEKLRFGLMYLLPKQSANGITVSMKIKHYRNITKLTPLNAATPTIVMASNSPSSKLNYLTHPRASRTYIKRVIDYAKNLPRSAQWPLVTFHLNTLLTHREWIKHPQRTQDAARYWMRIFRSTILPSVQEVSRYARVRNVRLLVETTPVPEFGDLTGRLAKLGNPYPLYSRRGTTELRKCGVHIALDLSHTHTLFEAATHITFTRDQDFQKYKGIFESDLPYLRTHNLLDEIRSLKKGDLVHLNDGLFLPSQPNRVTHKESLTLGRGTIINLPAIIREISKKRLPAVLEVSEQNYKTRRNMLRSISFLKQALQ